MRLATKVTVAVGESVDAVESSLWINLQSELESNVEGSTGDRLSRNRACPSVAEGLPSLFNVEFIEFPQFIESGHGARNPGFEGFSKTLDFHDFFGGSKMENKNERGAYSRQLARRSPVFEIILMLLAHW